MRNSRQKVLGKKIKRIRKSNNLTQVDLSVEVGLSPSYISSIEQGARQPSLKTLNKIAKALKVNVKEFF